MGVIPPAAGRPGLAAAASTGFVWEDRKTGDRRPARCLRRSAVDDGEPYPDPRLAAAGPLRPHDHQRPGAGPAAAGPAPVRRGVFRLLRHRRPDPGGRRRGQPRRRPPRRGADPAPGAQAGHDGRRPDRLAVAAGPVVGAIGFRGGGGAVRRGHRHGDVEHLPPLLPRRGDPQRPPRPRQRLHGRDQPGDLLLHPCGRGVPRLRFRPARSLPRLRRAHLPGAAGRGPVDPRGRTGAPGSGGGRAPQGESCCG